MMKSTFTVSDEARRAALKAENEKAVDMKIKACLQAENPFSALCDNPFYTRKSLNVEGKEVTTTAVVYPSRLYKALAAVDIFTAVSAENAASALYTVAVKYITATAGAAVDTSVSFGAVKKAFYIWLEKAGLQDRNVSPAAVRLALHSLVKLVKSKEGSRCFDVSCITPAAVEKAFFAVVCDEDFTITSKDLKKSALEKAAVKAAAAAADEVKARENFLSLMNEKLAAAEKAAAAEKGEAEKAAAAENAAAAKKAAAAVVADEVEKAQTAVVNEAAALARKAGSENLAQEILKIGIFAENLPKTKKVKK